MSSGRDRLWDAFCEAHGVLSRGVPLFAEDEGRVRSAPYGRDGRLVLCRSAEMEALLVREVELVLADPAVFPPDEVFALLERSEDTSANTQRTDIWEEFKQKLGG